MKAKIYYLPAVIVFLSLFASCVSSDKVVSGGWLQKRKFNKGFYVSSKSGVSKKKTDLPKREKDSSETVTARAPRSIYVHPALIIPDVSVITDPVFRSEPVKKKNTRSVAKPVKRKTTGMITIPVAPLSGFAQIPYAGFHPTSSRKPDSKSMLLPAALTLSKLMDGHPLTFAGGGAKSFHVFGPATLVAGDVDTWALLCFIFCLLTYVFLYMQIYTMLAMFLFPLTAVMSFVSFIVFFSRGKSNHNAVSNSLAIAGFVGIVLLLLIALLLVVAFA